MKRYSLLGLILSVNLAVGCGTEKQNVVPTINVTADQVLFTSNEYINNNFNELYAIDLVTKKFNTLRHIDASSNAEAYQINDDAGNLDHFYHVEKFSNQKIKSRVTNYSSTLRQNENINFPINLYDLVLHKGKLLGIGYDDQKIIKTDLNLSEEIPATFIKGLEPGNEAVTLTDKNISSILIAKERVFVVSGGSSGKNDRDKEEKKPKVYLLNKALNAVEKTWPIENCFNAFSLQRVEDDSKLLVSCNPNYEKNEKNIPSFVLIDANKIDLENKSSLRDTGAEADILKGHYKNSELFEVKINGISADKKSVLMTEYSAWQVVKNSYWYNIETGAISPTKNVAGHVIYNKKHNSYLFSCHLKDNVCEKDKFVLAKDMYGSDPELIDVKVKGIFSGFAKVLN